MTTQVTLPKVVEMINPTLQALRRLGGKGTKDEILDQVMLSMGLSEAQLQITYTVQGTEIPKIVNRLAWVKVYLGAVGFVEGLTGGVWALTKEGFQQEVVEPQETMSRARAILKR